MLRGAADSPGQAAEAGLTGKLGGVMSGGEDRPVDWLGDGFSVEWFR